MALTEYVKKLGEIRAVLGTSLDELKDEVLLLPLYEQSLIKELADISPNCLADYQTVEEKEQADKTTAEVDFQRAFELFAIFSVSKNLTTSLPLFSPKMKGDGKASVNRFSDSPYKQTIKAVKSSYDEYRTYLVTTYAVYGGGTAAVVTPIPLVGIMSPASDPVTGT